MTLREVALCATALLLTGCHHDALSTGPKGLDPTVLIRNDYSGSTDGVLFTWRDGNGVLGATDTVPPHTRRCEHFLARPDSASWYVEREFFGPDSAGWHSFGWVTWFDPAVRPYWLFDAGNPTVEYGLQRDTTDSPC